MEYWHPLLGAVIKTWREQTLYSKPENYVFPSYKLDGKKPRVGSMIFQAHHGTVPFLVVAEGGQQLMERFCGQRKVPAEGELANRVGKPYL